MKRPRKVNPAGTVPTNWGSKQAEFNVVVAQNDQHGRANVTQNLLGTKLHARYLATVDQIPGHDDQIGLLKIHFGDDLKEARKDFGRVSVVALAYM